SPHLLRRLRGQPLRRRQPVRPNPEVRAEAGCRPGAPDRATLGPALGGTSGRKERARVHPRPAAVPVATDAELATGHRPPTTDDRRPTTHHWPLPFTPLPPPRGRPPWTASVV